MTACSHGHTTYNEQDGTLYCELCHSWVITTVCAVCGGPVDPDVTHPRHRPDCPRAEWGIGWDCQCPEVCAACCTDADCPTRTPQETRDA